MSAMSEAKKRANKKWNDANMKERYDRVQLVLPKGRKAELQAAAEQHGQSVNGFINSLIDEALECERAGAVPCDISAGKEEPAIGSSEWWALRAPAEQPHEEAGDNGSSAGACFPFFPDDEETPRPVVGVPPMQPAGELPEENEEDLPW